MAILKPISETLLSPKEAKEAMILIQTLKSGSRISTPCPHRLVKTIDYIVKDRDHIR